MNEANHNSANGAMANGHAGTISLPHVNGAHAPAPTRDIQKAGPWAWCEKSILRRIRDAFDRTANVASALGVYVALCEVASDKQAAEFLTTHSHLALLAGLSARTVGERIRELNDLGVIEVHTPDLKAPSRYRLLPDTQSLPSVEQPLPNDTQRLPSVRQRGQKSPLPRSEECTEESLEESSTETLAPKSKSGSEKSTNTRRAPRRITRHILRHVHPDAPGLLDFLNKEAGRAFRQTPANLDLITDRLREPGISAPEAARKFQRMVCTTRRTACRFGARLAR